MAFLTTRLNIWFSVTSCRQKFKKLQIITVPNLYILEMMFVIKILTSSKLMFQFKEKIQDKSTNFIYNQRDHLQSKRESAIPQDI